MKAEDKNRKKAWKAEQKAAARAAFPLQDAELHAMFEDVETRLRSEGCDHTRRFTKAWLEERDADTAAVLAWLEETGGFCDCEVAGNSREHWEANRA